MGPRMKYVAVCVAAIAALGLAACDHENPLEPSCTIVLEPSSLAFPLGGGTGVVKGSASTTQCEWTAAASASWISIASGASGTGSGSITYTVAPNSASSPRSGAVAVGTQVHTITQDGQAACAYDVSPSSASFDSAGGQGTLTVTTTSACAWTATTSDPWIAIATGNGGQGSGTI